MVDTRGARSLHCSSPMAGVVHPRIVHRCSAILFAFLPNPLAAGLSEG